MRGMRRIQLEEVASALVVCEPTGGRMSLVRILQMKQSVFLKLYTVGKPIVQHKRTITLFDFLK
jgi:hypothetical protein